MTTQRPAARKRWRRLHDVLFIILALGWWLFVSRPWIAHPLSTTIGFYDSAHEMPSTDTMLCIVFSGWLKFAVVELHQSPFHFTKYLMFPGGASQAYSYDGLGIALVVALLACVMPLLPAYNVALLLGLVLCGYETFRLARRWWGRGLLAWTIGLTGLMIPFLYQRFPVHPTLIYIWTLPTAMHLFFNLRARPTWKRTAAWGLSFLLLALGSWYLLMTALVFVAAAGAAWLVERGGPPRRRRLMLLAAGSAGGMAPVLAMGWGMMTQAGNRTTMPLSMLADFSTPLIQYLLPFPHSLAGDTNWGRALNAAVGTQWEGLAGGPIVCFALLLLYLLWRRPGGPRLTLALTALIGVVLTLGPYLQVLHVRPNHDGLKLPMYYLGRLSRMFTMARAPGRSHVVVVFAALLGSGQLLHTWRARHFRGVAARRVAWPALLAGMTALNAFWTIHFYPGPVFPNPTSNPFYEELARQGGRGAIMDVPMSYYEFPTYSLEQLWHRRPITTSWLFHDALGHESTDFVWKSPLLPFFMVDNSSYTNPGVVQKLLDPSLLNMLAKTKIEYVVIHRNHIRYIMDTHKCEPSTAAIYEQLENAWRDRLVYRDALVSVYSTGYHPKTKPPAAGAPVR